MSNADTASALQLEVRHSLSDVTEQSWNALNVLQNPFLRHEFLAALEQTGCLGQTTGWFPRYFLLWNNNHSAAPGAEKDDDAERELIAAVPCFVKTNSYGEFVFDFAWAESYQQHGLSYYPKLVAAVPFTPATGQRILISPEHPRKPIISMLATSIRHYCREQDYSSLHWLFPTQEECDQLCEQAPAFKNKSQADALKEDEINEADEATVLIEHSASDHLQRINCQYHWRNRGYTSFNDFLQQCTAKRRKTIKRERRYVSDAKLRVERRLGASLSDQEWQWVHELYCATYDRKWGSPSLTLDFFRQMGKTMGEATLIVFAYDSTDETPDAPIACSIMFSGGGCLYGRYWGCRVQHNSLHFEACYYQGIEYCLEQGFETFEPGAQGEHKITRGFEPTITYSAHYLAEPAFRDAVNRFLQDESRYIRQRCEGLTNLLPFKADLDLNK
ncbi:MAG: GNAT family N-acetyltransferase [Granulosicoccaceae bacterium]